MVVVKLSLHSDAAVAAYESYIGLAEATVGIIPGWGGSKEMAVRASQAQDHWKDFDRPIETLLWHTLMKPKKWAFYAMMI